MRLVYLLAALPFIGILVGTPFVNRVEPFALYGGIGEMFREIQAQKPGFLILPDEG